MFRLICLACCLSIVSVADADELKDLQTNAVSSRKCDAAHWGVVDGLYSSWTSHTNRLIPVYTFGTKGGGAGIDLSSYTDANSVYRDRSRLQRLYRSDAENTVDADAPYMDQTNVFDLQRAALESGRKHVFVVVFDGMDWHTTRAASIWNLQRVAYDEGRGAGTHFQEYQADGTTQYGWMVTSPASDGVQVDVNLQRVKNPGGGLAGGYNSRIGGAFPWSMPSVAEYLVAGPKEALVRHAYTDSAASATSMFCGIKTYNGAIGVGPQGQPALSAAHLAQAKGYKVGAVTSVPISHATPAATYAHNVHRDDYQDISRDLLGLPSISHPEQPLQGLDLLIGGGYGVEVQTDGSQGENFVPGNKYLTQSDLHAVDVANGGRYVVAQRTVGVPGADGLMTAARQAVEKGARLLGFFGVFDQGSHGSGNLPFATADRKYDPAPDADGFTIAYQQADLQENPALADMASAALTVLAADDSPFWLMVEAGDVDWANHANNLDDSIGAVNSGDAAVRVITDWVEQNSNWDESLLIVTADHGHYLIIDRPELLIRSGETTAQR
ncbi:MAG: alkaline phosphatase [Planctomycetales bacterium]|nr:alkaline phosphatase [Planctomycetales bacterium]